MATRANFEHILGHYRLLERLREGGMGVDYRACDEHLQRELWIKLLPASAVTDESARRRFHREALTRTRLNHPDRVENKTLVRNPETQAAEANEENSRTDISIKLTSAVAAGGRVASRELSPGLTVDP